MTAGDPGLRALPHEAGLCSACRHARVVETARGSSFVLCERSRSEPRFARYPRLPMIRCPGFEQPIGG